MDRRPGLPDSAPPELPDEPPPVLPSGDPPASGSGGSSGKLAGTARPAFSSLKVKSANASAADKYRLAARSSARNASPATSAPSISASSAMMVSPEHKRSSLVLGRKTAPDSSGVDGKSAGSAGSVKVGSLRRLSVPEPGAKSPAEGGRRSSTSPSTSPLMLRRPTSTLATSPSLARSSRMQSATNRRLLTRPVSGDSEKPAEDPPSAVSSCKAATTNKESNPQQAAAGGTPAAPAAVAAPEDDPSPAGGAYSTSLTSVRDSITRQRAGSVHGSSGPLTATARLRAARRATQMRRKPSEDAGDEPVASAPATATPAAATTITTTQAEKDDKSTIRRKRTGSAGRLLDEATRPRTGSTGSASALEDARQRIRAGRMSRSASTELLDSNNDGGEDDNGSSTDTAARSASPSIVATTSKASALISVARTTIGGAGTTASSDAAAAAAAAAATGNDDKADRRPLMKSPFGGSQTQLRDSSLSAIASATLGDSRHSATKTSATTVGVSTSPRKVPSVEKPPPLRQANAAAPAAAAATTATAAAPAKKKLTLGERRQRIADAKSKRDSLMSTGSLGSLVSPLSSISRISDLSVSALMDELDRDDDDDDSGTRPPSIAGSPPPIPSEAPPPLPEGSEPSTPVAPESRPIAVATSTPKDSSGVATLLFPPSPSPPRVPDVAPPTVPDEPPPLSHPQLPMSPEPSIVGKLSPKTSLFGSVKKSPTTAKRQAMAVRRKNSGSLFGFSVDVPDPAPEVPSEPPPALPASSAADPVVATTHGTTQQASLAARPSKYSTRSKPATPVAVASEATTAGVKVVDEGKDAGAAAATTVRKTTVVKKKRYVASKREGGSRPLHETDAPRQSLGSLRSADSYESLDWDRKSGRSMSVSSKVSDPAGNGESFDSPLTSPKANSMERSTGNDSATHIVPKPLNRESSQKSTHSRTGSQGPESADDAAAAAASGFRRDSTRKSYSRAERDEARERFVQVHRKDSLTTSPTPTPTPTPPTVVAAPATGDKRSSMRPLSTASSLALGDGSDMLSALLGDLDDDAKRLLSPGSSSEPPVQLPATSPPDPVAVKRMSTSSRDDDSPMLVSSGSQRRSQRRVSLTPTHSKVMLSRAQVVSVPQREEAAADSTPEKTPERVADTKSRLEADDDVPQLPGASPPPTKHMPRMPASKSMVRAATLDSGAVGQLMAMHQASAAAAAATSSATTTTTTAMMSSNVEKNEIVESPSDAINVRQEVRSSTLPPMVPNSEVVREGRQSEVHSWTNNDVGDWLAAQGFGDLVHVFQDQAVTGEDLAGMTANRLETMGLESRDRQRELIAQRNTLFDAAGDMALSDMAGDDVAGIAAAYASDEVMTKAEERVAQNTRRGQWRSASASGVIDRSVNDTAGTGRGLGKLSDSNWQSQDDKINAQLAQLRERQQLTDRLLGSREDLFVGMQRTDAPAATPPAMSKQSTDVSLASTVSPLVTSPVDDSAFDTMSEGERRRLSTASQLERRRSIRSKPLHTWSENDLAIYLCDHGVSLSVTDKLRGAGVDGEQMVAMTVEDLDAMAITGHQADHLLDEVSQIRNLFRQSVRSRAISQQSFQELEEDGADGDPFPDDAEADASPGRSVALSPSRLSNIPEASLSRGQALHVPIHNAAPASQPASDSESDAEDMSERILRLQPSGTSFTSGTVSPSGVPPPDMFRTLSKVHKKGRAEHVSPRLVPADRDVLRPESTVTKNLSEWSHREVLAWMEECQFSEYRSKAEEMLLDGRQLSVVDLDQLDQLGVDTDEDREAFLAAVYQASSSINATDSVKALLRGSGEGENREKLAAMVEVLDAATMSSPLIAELTTYLSGSLQDVLWPVENAPAVDSTSPSSPGESNLTSTGRPMVLEIQDARNRHKAKQHHDKKGAKNDSGKRKKKIRGHVSFTDDDVPTSPSHHPEFEGQRSRSVGKGPFKSKLARWFGEGDHHYAIQASVRSLSRSRTQDLMQGNVKVYLRNLQPDSEYKAFHITSTTTAFHLIELVLERMGMTEDPQRYRLVETSLRPGVPDRDVASFECPLLLQSLWHNENEFHFGLRGQPVGTIKVSIGIHGAPKPDVTLQVSPYTSAYHATRLLLRKIGFDDGTAELYCMTEETAGGGGEGILGDGEYPLLVSVGCGHKSTLWLRARPAFARVKQRPASLGKQTSPAASSASPELEDAYNLLHGQAVRQRLQSEREREMLEGEVKRLESERSVSPTPEKVLPELDERSLERITQITKQLQIYVTRLKETTVHAEMLAATESKSAKEVISLNGKLADLEFQQQEKTTQLYKLLEEKEMLEEQLSTKENTITYLRRENEILSADNKAARESGVNPVTREMEESLSALRSENAAKDHDLAQLKEDLGQTRRLSVRERRKSEVAPPRIEARPLHLAQLAQQAGAGQYLQLVSADIDCRSSKDPGWLLSPTASDTTTQVAVLALQSGGPAQKCGTLQVGDSIIEINNHPITKEEDISVALKSKRLAAVVVARIVDEQEREQATLSADQQKSIKASQADIRTAVSEAGQKLRSEHAEEVDSLHVLMQTLETQVQEREKERQALQSRVEVLQSELVESEASNETAGRAELQVRDLREQLMSSEEARKQLRASLGKLSTPHSSTQNIPMATLEQDLASIHKKLILSEEERSVLRSAANEKDARITSLSAAMKEKETQLQTVSQERDSALQSLRDTVGRAATGAEAGVVGGANREDDYMSKLLTLVIDEAPHLLGKIGKLTQDQGMSKSPAQDEWY